MNGTTVLMTVSMCMYMGADVGMFVVSFRGHTSLRNCISHNMGQLTSAAKIRVAEHIE